LTSNKPPAHEIRKLKYDEDDRKEEPDIIYVQETYEFPNRAFGIGRTCKIFTAGNEKNKATCVIPNNKIGAMLITQT